MYALCLEIRVIHEGYIFRYWVNKTKEHIWKSTFLKKKLICLKFTSAGVTPGLSYIQFLSERLNESNNNSIGNIFNLITEN